MVPKLFCPCLPLTWSTHPREPWSGAGPWLGLEALGHGWEQGQEPVAEAGARPAAGDGAGVELAAELGWVVVPPHPPGVMAWAWGRCTPQFGDHCANRISVHKKMESSWRDWSWSTVEVTTRSLGVKKENTSGLWRRKSEIFLTQQKKLHDKQSY